MAWLGLVCLPCLPVQAMAAMPMGYLWTQGPSADPVTRLTWWLMVISLLVIAIITGLLLHACLHRRAPEKSSTTNPPGKMPVMPDQGGMRWIYLGVGISTVVLFFSTVWTIRALAAVSAPPRAAFNIDVIAHQWWWEVRYPGATADQSFVTANEIHIPVNEPVHLTLKSDDVIHSFWIPKLGGKTDVIPGQTNHTWLQAAQAGRYRGQCGEFCGAQHAHMAMVVVAEERSQFEAWQQGQRASSVTGQQSAAQERQQKNLQVAGETVFVQHCAECHTVRGTAADGKDGPDLTHLMSRATIAAGMLPNTRGALGGWVADAQGVKPGARMPTMKLSPQELHAVVDYLQTLD